MTDVFKFYFSSIGFTPKNVCHDEHKRCYTFRTT